MLREMLSILGRRIISSPYLILFFSHFAIVLGVLYKVLAVGPPPGADLPILLWTSSAHVCFLIVHALNHRHAVLERQIPLDIKRKGASFLYPAVNLIFFSFYYAVYEDLSSDFYLAFFLVIISATGFTRTKPTIVIASVILSFLAVSLWICRVHEGDYWELMKGNVIPRSIALVIVGWGAVITSTQFYCNRVETTTALSIFRKLHFPANTTNTDPYDGVSKALTDLSYTTSSIWLLDADGRLRTHDRSKTASIDDPVWERLSKDGRCQLVLRKRKLNTLVKRVFAPHAILVEDKGCLLKGNSCLAVALERRGKIYGKLMLGKQYDFPYSAHDMIMAQLIGQHISQIADNNILLSQLRKTRDMMSMLPFSVFELNDQQEIAWVNDAYCAFLGKRRDELIGKTGYDLFTKKDAERFEKSNAAIMDSMQPKRLTEDGPFGIPVQGFKVPISNNTMTGTGVLCAFWDSTISKESLERFKTAELLLRELHHRLKNNLMLAIGWTQGFMKMQSLDETPGYIDECQKKLQGLALIHDLLSNKGDHLDLPTYLRKVAEQLQKVFGGSINVIDKTVTPIQMDWQRALRVGMVMNELFTNVLKHAKEKKLLVLLRRTVEDGKQFFILRVRHKGVSKSQLEKLGTGGRLLSELVADTGGRIVFGEDQAKGRPFTEMYIPLTGTYVEEDFHKE